MELTFRFAEERDTPLILDFIKWLADYEQLLDQVVADEATLTDQLFRKKNAEVLFALEDGKEVGFALFFHNFSTFLGRSGLYLEDLFVLPDTADIVSHKLELLDQDGRPWPKDRIEGAAVANP